MKKVLYFFSLAFVIQPCFSQYIVTKVTGTVKNETTHEILKPGSRYAKTDKLTWITPNAIVRTILAGKGVYIINQKTDDASGSTMLEIVKFTLHLKSKEDNLSGRGDNDNLVPDNLNTEENINTKNLISGENKYLFDKSLYDVSAGNKFFLQTEFPGGAPVIKSLRTSLDTLILYSDDFKKATDENTADAKYKLGFYSKENNTSKLLVQIDPYFDSTAEMEIIIQTIVSADGKSDKEKLKDQCYHQIYQAMGKPSDITFQNSFDKIFASSLQNSTSKK